MKIDTVTSEIGYLYYHVLLIKIYHKENNYYLNSDKRSLNLKILRDTKGTFHAEMGTIKDKQYGPNRSRRYQEEVARIHRRILRKRS